MQPNDLRTHPNPSLQEIFVCTPRTFIFKIPFTVDRLVLSYGPVLVKIFFFNDRKSRISMTPGMGEIPLFSSLLSKENNRKKIIYWRRILFKMKYSQILYGLIFLHEEFLGTGLERVKTEKNHIFFKNTPWRISPIPVVQKVLPKWNIPICHPDVK